jgi:hypothetical protein
MKSRLHSSYDKARRQIAPPVRYRTGIQTQPRKRKERRRAQGINRRRGKDTSGPREQTHLNSIIHIMNQLA